MTAKELIEHLQAEPNAEVVIHDEPQGRDYEVVVEMKYGEAIRLHRGKRYLRNRPAPAVGE